MLTTMQRQIALCFIAAVVTHGGCDFIEPGECLADGELFGPCIESECANPSLMCLAGKVGDICVSIDTTVYDQAEIDSCGAWLSVTIDCDGESCVPACDDGEACSAGTVCDDGLLVCVHPY